MVVMGNFVGVVVMVTGRVVGMIVNTLAGKGVVLGEYFFFSFNLS